MTAPFEIVERRDVMVRMRDGVELATNLYFPGRGGAPAPGRFPAMVRRTPYGKDFTQRRSMFWRRLVPAGNCYVNRSIIGAVVGVQPFGGEGLSGTGPKAGGPWALTRFAVERSVTVNTAAQGGDPALFDL